MLGKVVIYVDWDDKPRVVLGTDPAFQPPRIWNSLEHYWQEIEANKLDIVSAIAYDKQGTVVAVINHRDI